MTRIVMLHAFNRDDCVDGLFRRNSRAVYHGRSSESTQDVILQFPAIDGVSHLCFPILWSLTDSSDISLGKHLLHLFEVNCSMKYPKNPPEKKIPRTDKCWMPTSIKFYLFVFYISPFGKPQKGEDGLKKKSRTLNCRPTLDSMSPRWSYDENF
ncbi:hypothetical protein CEXT_601141 [Caerostris extrusa]|uniref:Uncharacterized protein n=1 Tax=Caerostris extrusa TaxID=172846 RepID=A0AAV4YCA4_CAEEX|nr:hypothetical protein CEXT_601141 [Caerostris extrusa]